MRDRKQQKVRGDGGGRVEMSSPATVLPMVQMAGPAMPAAAGLPIGEPKNPFEQALEGAAEVPLPVPTAPAAPKAIIAVGDKLRCNDFEGGLVVLGVVNAVDLSKRQALLHLPALNREWPIDFDAIQGSGSTWTHIVGHYPAPGADEEFDAKFRPEMPDGTSCVPERRTRFNPPRAARRGHVWAQCVVDLAAAGYDVAGKAARSWKSGVHGEFLAVAVEGSPDAFEPV
jgi:hypothetical protein